MSHVGFITRWVEQHGQGFRRGDFCQYIAITGVDYQHFRRFRVGDKCAVARCVQAQVDKEMLFPIIQQFFAAKNFVGGGVDGNEFTVRIGGVQAFSLAVDRQSGAHFAGILDGVLQFNGLAVHHPNHAFFTNAANVYRVGGVIGGQLTRLQRANIFRTLTRIQHQTSFHRTRFGIHRRNRAVYRVAEPQRMRGVVDGGTKRFEIVMNHLGHFEGDRVKTINHPAGIQFAAL